MQREISILVLAAAAVLLLMPPAVPPEDANDEPDYQAPDLIDAAVSVAQEAQDMLSTESDEVKNQNEQAFLWTLRVSEGTSGPDGYRTIVGGSTFDSFVDHPRVLIPLPNLGISSIAAGAYQIIRRTWDGVRGKLGLTDFSPVSQDAAALELIRQRGALADVRAGRFATAIDKCKKEWASLPGAGYGQHENTLAKLQSAYTIAGGYIA
jgi:muramidase (phage lysozyme)